MRADSVAATVTRRVSGLAFLVVLSLLIALSIAIYDKQFTDAAMVTLETGTVGHQMHPGADVKVHGAVVGEVRSITVADSNGGARMQLALNPADMGNIPSGVRAHLLPATVFGKRYVALIPPPTTGGVPLEPGEVISQDRSSNAIELQELLNNVMDLLTSVKPQKLSATLNAMARALEGRGEQFGDNLVELDAYLEKLNPHLPALNKNIKELGDFAETYRTAAPDLVDALYDFTTTSRTIVDKREDFARSYRDIKEMAEVLDDFFRENEDNLIRLPKFSRPSLRVLAKYAPQFPCLFKTLADTVPLMDRALGKGTDQPGVNIKLYTIPRTADARYRPGRDTPKYTAKGGPHCYPTPYKGGGTGTDTIEKSTPTRVKVPVAAGGKDLGLPNSPQENTLINELLAPGLREVPEALPDWSSVLAGPVFRGELVEVDTQ